METEITKKLKAELWRRFGTKECPAEWDGISYGGVGGKLSQRFWEYFKALELLDLDKNSVLLDIGGNSSKTGTGFLGLLLSKYIKKVIIMDPNISKSNSIDNIILIKKKASYSKLKKLFNKNKDITHITSISVFEHIEENLRKKIVDCINNHFKGVSFVISLEYHPKKSFFEYQLTTKKLSKLFKNFSNFYLDKLESSPIKSENSFYKNNIPKWYPIILKFINKK